MFKIAILFLTTLIVYSQQFNRNSPLDVSYESKYDSKSDEFSVSAKVRVKKKYLLFEKENSEFTSTFVLRQSITDQTGRVIWSKTDEHTLVEADINFSPRDTFLDTFNIQLKSDDYNYNATIIDGRNNSKFHKELKMKLNSSIQTLVEIDNISFFEKQKGTFKYVAMNSLDRKADLHRVSFSLFSHSYLGKELLIKVSISNALKQIIFAKTYKKNQFSSSKKLDKLSIDLEKEIFSFDNDYLLKIELVDNKGESINITRKIFSFIRADFPSSITEMNQALEYLSHVLNSDSIDYYKDKPLAKSLRFYKDFWKSLSGTSNEGDYVKLMQEYYQRIDYCNKVFSSMGRNGWMTDRGRIFIKFGRPDDIINEPLQMNSKPYIVWSYLSLRKQFVFVDHSGFGDFRLTENSRQAEHY